MGKVVTCARRKNAAQQGALVACRGPSSLPRAHNQPELPLGSFQPGATTTSPRAVPGSTAGACAVAPGWFLAQAKEPEVEDTSVNRVTGG